MIETTILISVVVVILISVKRKLDNNKEIDNFN